MLVTGGLGVHEYYTSLATAELYNPSTGKWTGTGGMSVGRTALTATLLKNGEVLVAGGSDYEVNCYATAELYNPSTGEWTLTGNMTQPRCLHSATLLPNGEVLVAGVNSIYSSNTATITAAEMYNPATGTWTKTGSLNVSRASAATLLLENGNVLSAGGYTNTGNENPNTYLTSAELYNASSRKWTLTSSMSGTLGVSATPVLLANGDMLIANAAQFYNPASATWTATDGSPQNQFAFAATKAAPLNNGAALATGGECKGNKEYSCGGAPTGYTFLYNAAITPGGNRRDELRAFQPYHDVAPERQGAGCRRFLLPTARCPQSSCHRRTLHTLSGNLLRITDSDIDPLGSRYSLETRFCLYIP